MYLGKRIRDRISGVEGICCSEHHLFNGNIQYGIQPPSADMEKLPPAEAFDFHTIELVTPENVKSPTPESVIYEVASVPHDPEHIIPIGSEVRDRVRPSIRGIVTSYTIYCNGCVYYHIVLTDMKIKDVIEPHIFMPFQRLIKISDGLNYDSVNKPAEAKPKTGGPSTRVQRAR